MEVPVDEVVDDAGDEHQVDERRDQRQQHLEDEDVGQREQAHARLLRMNAARCFQTACRMPKDQRKRWRIRPFALTGASVKASAGLRR